jgi:HPt (histidine-containing phosphotransfer) domain-containing protein
VTVLSTLDPVAVERLRRIGGSTLARQMIELFLELGPGRVTELADGVAAADAGRVERAAHTLKSTAANLGAVRVQELAAALEERAGRGVIDATLAEAMMPAWEQSVAALRGILEDLC